MNKYEGALYKLRILERQYVFKQTRDVVPQVWCDTLQELVEKATPKKIVKREEDIGEELAEAFDCERYITVEYCPICGEKLRGIEKYCPECGRRIDWSEDDE